jgi:hypothetical protein
VLLDQEVVGVGRGSSKRGAEQSAAQDALAKLVLEEDLDEGDGGVRARREEVSANDAF